MTIVLQTSSAMRAGIARMTSLPLSKAVSHNQDHYEVSLLK
jgi:hypothetical protein